MIDRVRAMATIMAVGSISISTRIVGYGFGSQQGQRLRLGLGLGLSFGSQLDHSLSSVRGAPEWKLFNNTTRVLMNDMKRPRYPWRKTYSYTSR